LKIAHREHFIDLKIAHREHFDDLKFALMEHFLKNVFTNERFSVILQRIKSK